MSGRGKSQKSLDLIGAAARILEEIQPATVRAVCYRLFVEKVIDSMAKANTQRVSEQLVYAREEALIPWEYIVDGTRAPERVSTWHDPDSIFRAAVHGYRRDYWEDQECVVEVWSEKATVAGTLKPVLDEFGVTFRVQHGFGSATSLYDAAQDSASTDNPMIVLYVGDWDPSGLHMSEVDIPNRIERYGGVIQLERVAIDERDTNTKGIPSFPAADKARDARHRWFVERYGQRCWELDALPPNVLRSRVHNAICSYINEQAWNHALAIEKAQRESMAAFVKGYAKSISGQDPEYA